eukprot:15776-Heterococcus_DN1.PRE.2
MSSKKRGAASATSPLEDAGILLHVLQILGPGQHLLISAVSKAWRDIYARVPEVTMAQLTHSYDDQAFPCTIDSQTTLCSALFASATSFNWACACGLDLESDSIESIERVAGRVADVPTLRAAHELGLQLTDAVLIGTAESLAVLKLQWLHVEQARPLPAEFCSHAARRGSIDMLRWLKEHGSVFEASNCAGAAAGGHQHVLQYLRDEGCEWDWSACSAAAKHGHLDVLKWLREQGCPWECDEICGDAALSGSVEMLLYLQDEGCEYNEDTMIGAAMRGHRAVCEYLVAEQCPTDRYACQEAAENGHFEVVRFLHGMGVPGRLRTSAVLLRGKAPSSCCSTSSSKDVFST